MEVRVISEERGLGLAAAEAVQAAMQAPGGVVGVQASRHPQVLEVLAAADLAEVIVMAAAAAALVYLGREQTALLEFASRVLPVEVVAALGGLLVWQETLLLLRLEVGAHTVAAAVAQEQDQVLHLCRGRVLVALYELLPPVTLAASLPQTYLARA